MKQRYEKFTALLFGEGGKETRFFAIFEKSAKFKELFPMWSINVDHASGEACKVILEKCIRFCSSNNDFDLVLCFIDTDKLHSDFKDSHEQHKRDLEELASSKNIIIVWQEQDHEQELSRAIGRAINKSRLKQQLKAHEIELINSDFAKRILKHFTDYEEKLDD